MGFDVYLSYSPADASIAKQLRRSLRAVRPLSSFMVLPWKSSIRVFSHPADASGDFAIEETHISESLARASYLIFLASAESAHSSHIQRELEYWLKKHSSNRLILVWTDGEIENALPEDKRWLTEEQFYVDLRWARDVDNLADRYQFRDSIATIAAVIYGVSKDSILSAELQRNRRLRRATILAFVFVISLLLLSLTMASYSFSQLSRARIASLQVQSARELAIRERESADQSRMIAQKEEARAAEMAARVDQLQRELARKTRPQNRNVPSEEAMTITNLRSELAYAQQDLKTTRSSMAEYKKGAEEANKLVSTYQRQVSDQQNQISELSSRGKVAKTSFIADFIARNSLFLLSIIVAAALLVLFSTRLILQLLQIEIGILKPLAIGFYLLPFGRWKLFRKYRKEFLNNKQVKYHSNHYVDVPFNVDESPIDESLSLQQCLTNMVVAQNVTIIAGGGRGKTTLCYRLAQLTLENHLSVNGRPLLPVIVDGLSYEGNIVDLVATTLRQEKVYVNSAIVQSQISSGYILIVFDGWSEVRDFYSNPDEASDLPDFIRKNPETRFIFTSRNQLPGAIRHALHDTVTFTLCDLNGETIIPFLRKYLVRRKSSVGQLASELLNGPMNIPQSPLMMRLIATVFDETGEIPKERVILFSKYAEELLRPEAVGGVDKSGLYYIIKYLVRNTYLATEGNRGFSFQKGIELLDQIKTMTGNFGIRLLPIDILKLLIGSGLYQRTGEFIRFFHDSFESYFAASALDDDFREEKRDLLIPCATNPRLIETWDFLLHIVKERDEENKLQDFISAARNENLREQMLH